MDIKGVVESVGVWVDGAGVLVVVLGLLYASARFVATRRRHVVDSYRRYRQDLGKAILLGLEFLVAGDIIQTVAATPTLTSVTVLAIIVLIRTFLSMSLEVELEGRPPWRRTTEPEAARGADAPSGGPASA